MLLMTAEGIQTKDQATSILLAVAKQQLENRADQKDLSEQDQEEYRIVEKAVSIIEGSQQYKI